MNRIGSFGQWSVKEGAALQTLTDAQIIATSESDPSRFGEIFDRHFPAIHRYVNRRVGRELADDLASETFSIAFRNRERFDPSREMPLRGCTGSPRTSCATTSAANVDGSWRTPGPGWIPSRTAASTPRMLGSMRAPPDRPWRGPWLG